MSLQAMNDVLSILECLESNASVQEAQNSLQELLSTIPKAIDEIILLFRKPELRNYSHKLKLCSNQIAKVLPPLCRIISYGTDPAFKEICHYLIVKLRWCLSEIMRISNGGGIDEDSEPSGLFVQAIDKVVDVLNDENERCQNLHLYFEDLICHALTIAKMSENEDYNEITASCHNLLAGAGGVKSTDDIKKIPLKKDMIICALINLEKKVNIAVLRLFLYVMSKFLPPLKSIVKKSGPSCHVPSRHPSDIEEELQSLDLYFERVQLIGNYAVACSDCKKQKLRVQSCLASLEFLADYIIPTAESFYMDPANLIKRRLLQFLTDECTDELKTLTSLLDNIIDTTTFFQVLQEDLSHSIPNLKVKVSKGVYEPFESTEIITKCYKVISHLRTTEDPGIKDNPGVVKKTKSFFEAVRSHEALVPEHSTCDIEKFQESLDRIIEVVEDLDEYLSYICMGGNQKLKDSQTILETNHSSAVISSTPFKENGYSNNVHEASSPSPPNEECKSLDPFLNKIFETPVLQPTLYIRTPYRSLKKGTPRNLSFDISEVLESLDINYGLEEEEEEEVATSDSLTHVDEVEEDIQPSILYGSEISNISIGPSEFHSINTLRRNLDINFLENKIKQLTTNEI